MKNILKFRCRRASFPIVYAFGFLMLIAACREVNTAERKNAAMEALSTFALEEGFKIELIAAEPLIRDPVDMEIDEYGRLYVVEMPGYPLDKSGTGKIRILYDRDADGHMDVSRVFADSLVLPNSVMRWKKGVLVTDAPHVLYLEDTNGDDRADIRDTLLTGFALSNPQHNLNSPVLSVDNWIYLAHEGVVSTDTYQEAFGDQGTEVYFPARPDSPRLGKNAGGRSVRFRPDQFRLEELSSHSQFGHTFDQWGRHLLVSNANHIYHEVVAESYLRRNRDLSVSSSTQSLSDHADAAEVFPVTRNPQHQLLTDVGVITSACGLTAYLGGAFPPPYNADITFVAEPVSNLIHADRLEANGPTFTAKRVRPRTEFLASTDARFRPVNLYVGPDGALYVVDYYRQIIEHPEWMGQDVIESGNLYNDTDKGRIYRISAAHRKTPAGPVLGKQPDAELVGHLRSPNIWWRQNAQRLLIDRGNKQVVGALRAMARDTSAAGRLHALWTLEGLDALLVRDIRDALKDEEPGIRENAIRLAELHVGSHPQLQDALLAMQSDASTRVRFQLLCTLGFLSSPQAQRARHDLLFKDIDDKWMQIAALSAPGVEAPGLLREVIGRFREDIAGYRVLTETLAAMTASGGGAAPVRELILLASSQDQTSRGSAIKSAILDGLANGMADDKPAIGEEALRLLINTFFEDQSPLVRRAVVKLLKNSNNGSGQLTGALDRAARIAADHSEAGDRRADAIDLLSIQHPGKHTALLMKLFVPQEPLNVQLAAMRTLSAIPDRTLSDDLLQKWSALTPDIQDAAISTFLVSDDRIHMLLDAIISGVVQPSTVKWPARVRLMTQSNEFLRERARDIFTRNSNNHVTRSYYAQAMKMRGNESRGKEVYLQNCSLCHQIRGQMGIPIGPDLGTVHNWSPEAIIANTLAPGLSISSKYDLWTVETHNGGVFQGVIATETPGAITLRNNGVEDKTINRKEIRSLRAMNMSIMPEGLEKQIDHQQMADLVAFLKQNK